MFTEILRIKPQLSENDARQMESRLSGRFSRVAKRFGSGLKAVIKGSIIGISLGFLAKLLNPLKEVEERIRGLLKQGEDSRELAERFNTTQGKFRRIQDVSNIIGVSPDKLNELMTKYAEAIEKGRDEVLNPTKDKSESTKILGQFLKDQDLADSFFQFIQSLSKADPNQRRLVEKEVFGGVQTGSTKRLIEADFQKEFARLGGFSSEKIGTALDKLASLAEKDRINNVRLEQGNIVQSAGKITPGIIDSLAAAAKREQNKEQQELASFAAMQKAQAGIDEISKVLNDMLGLVRMGVGHLGDLIKWFKESKVFKGVSKFFGDK